MKIEHYCKNDPCTVCRDDLWCEVYSLTQKTHFHSPKNYVARKIMQVIPYSPQFCSCSVQSLSL